MWNYRILRDANYKHFIITECYYNEDGEIEGWTDTEGKGHAPWAAEDEGPETIRWVLEAMLQACDRPVLDESELLKKFETVDSDKEPYE